MIIVREILVAKPGMASKLAKLMKDVSKLMGHKARVMTDLTGQFNQVVMETEFRNLGQFERRMQDYGKNKKVGAKMAGYTDMYETGEREMFNVN